ncbi:MAG: metallophosphoesterase family protein [Acidimicrobiales bacterium]|jgi:alkaline phosphatase D
MTEIHAGEQRPTGLGKVVSRRLFLKGAAGAALAAAAAPLIFDGPAFASLGTGTAPEQVHLQWGADPSSSVVISWASPSPEPGASLLWGSSALLLSTPITPMAKQYTDGTSGETVYTYHAELSDLAADSTYYYQITDGAGTPTTFPSSGALEFTTAPVGRSAFSFTSFGDLGTPSGYSESQYNAYYAVTEVETLAPLFHLLNGDLCYADKLPATQPQPEVWRAFGLNVQRSAANRPWMPCIGNHEIEVGSTTYNLPGSITNENGIALSGLTSAGQLYAGGSYPQWANGMFGQASYQTRFTLPDNGTGAWGSGGFSGSFYSFRVGSVQFISLDANDVCYQDSGAFTTTALSGGVPANTGVYNRQYTGALGAVSADNTVPAGSNVQTEWLEATLRNAANDTTIDWIIVQMHQTALSSSHDNGSDLGIRQAWLPLFDQYQVDLVLCGHDHDYERSFPVRGFNHNQGTGLPGSGTGFLRQGQTGVETLQPDPVVTDDTLTTFDTSQGTVHLVLGGGGTNKPDNTYGLYGNSTIVDGRTVPPAGVNTYTNPKVTALSQKGLPDTWEPAVWSAKTDTTDAYGIAQFILDPGTTPGGATTLTLNYYHAPMAPLSTSTVPSPLYSLYDTVTFTRLRSDGASPIRPPVDTPQFSSPVLAVAGTAALGAGALYLTTRERSSPKVSAVSPYDN